MACCSCVAIKFKMCLVAAQWKGTVCVNAIFSVLFSYELIVARFLLEQV